MASEGRQITSSRLTNWWCKPPDASTSVRLVMTFGFVVIARGLAMVTGLDRLTTISPSLTVTVVALVVGVCAALVGARAYCGASLDRTRSERLRRDRFAVWLLSGSLWAAIVAVVVASLCSSVLEVGAQFLDGSREVFRGTVLAIRPMEGPRAVCKSHLDLRLTSEGSVISICLSTTHRGSLASEPLQPGMAATIIAKDTILGVVVLSVAPDS